MHQEQESQSRLTIQVAMTQAVLLGKVYKDNNKLCPDINIRWDQNLKFNRASMEVTNENYKDKLRDIMRELANWKTRVLKPLGRSNVANGLYLTSITYIATILPSLPDQEIYKTEADLYAFISRDLS